MTTQAVYPTLYLYPFPVDTPKGTKITITGGSYKGQDGYFLNWTTKRINVGIHLSDTSTIIRCLDRSNVGLSQDSVKTLSLNRIEQLFQVKPHLESNLNELCEAFTSIGVSARDVDFLDVLISKFAQSQRHALRSTIQSRMNIVSSDKE